MPAITASAAAAAQRLCAGEPVAIPTETVYGLAACADDDAAVERVFALKGRPAAHPLIVHVGDPADLAEYAAAVPQAAELLAREFMPGPLTLLLERKPGRAERAAAGGTLIGLRVPEHELARQVIRLAGCALAAPSANRFGRISPTCAQHVAADFADCPDLLILDGGPCSIGLESTIVLAAGDRLEIVRPGAIAPSAIEQVARMPIARKNADRIAAPGTHARHYSPRQPLRIVADEQLADAGSAAATIGFGPAPANAQHHWQLPPDPAAAARGLYAALRLAEQAGCPEILIAEPPAGESWDALRDRIRRAARD